jgi:hypothetical protein
VLEAMMATEAVDRTGRVAIHDGLNRFDPT